MRVRISNETLNYLGTWIRTDGIDLTQFRKNPILLYMHQRGCAIGTVEDIRVENGEVTGELKFDLVREESKIAKAQFEAGTLKMVSPGFSIVESSADPALLKPGQKLKTITKCRLDEVSVVDIGGNDDNMVLNYDGEKINLMAGGACAALQLTDINAQKENEHMKEIALILGLPETATAAEIMKAVQGLLALKTVNENLQQQIETLQLAGITQLVDEAVTAGKLDATKKAQFIELGKKMGSEDLKGMLDCMSAPVKPLNLVKPEGGVGVAEYKRLSDVPEEELKLMRENDVDTYRKLYKAEFGIECPQLGETEGRRPPKC